MLKFYVDAIGAILCITALIIVGNKKWWGWIFSLAAAVSYLTLGIIVPLYFFDRTEHYSYWCSYKKLNQMETRSERRKDGP